MNLLRFSSPYVITIFNLLLLEYFIMAESNLWFVIGALLVLFFFCFFLLLKGKLSEYRSKWQFMIGPLSLQVGVFLYLMFLEDFTYKHIFAVVGSLLLGLLFKALYNFFYNRRKYI